MNNQERRELAHTWLCEHEPIEEDVVALIRAAEERVQAWWAQEIEAERKRQNEKWGKQQHPIRSSACSPEHYARLAANAKRSCKDKAEHHLLSWYDILYEEFTEVFAHTDPTQQRRELIHVAAVAVTAIESLDAAPTKEDGVHAVDATLKEIQEVSSCKSDMTTG